MIKRSVGLTFLWGGLWLCSGIVVAQPAGDESASADLSVDRQPGLLDSAVEEVNVFGRQHNLLGQSVSASEGVVGAKDIEVRPLQRTGEVLELVPGMVVTQHSGSGKANQYFLRGTNLDHGTDFSTFVDGMPVNMRSHGHGQGYTDLNFVIPELVHSISFKKGPYYADVGDFSGVGNASINSQRRLSRSGVALTLGEDNYQRLLAMGDSALAGGNLLFALENQYYDGPWTDIDEDIEKLNAVLRYTKEMWGGELSMSAMAYDNSWNAADQIPQRAVSQGLIDQYGSLDTDVGGESSRYSLSAQWKNQRNSVNLYVIEYELELFSNFTYLLDDPVNGDEFEQYDSRRILGGEWRHLLPATGPLQQQFGVQWRYDDIDEVGLYRSANRQRLSTVREDSIKEGSVGLFWQGDVALTEKLTATAGLRYDYYDFDVDSDRPANSGSESDGIGSAKLTVAYRINANLESYVGYGQSFHSNDARGTTIRVDPVDGSAVDSVDPLVRSHGGEMGLRFFASGGVSASLALWTLDIDSELLFVGDAGNTEASRASERRGVEVTLYYPIAPNWTADLEYAYTRARFSENAAGEGDYIEGALPEVVSAGLSYSDDDAWYGSVRVRHFGERSLDSFNDMQSDPTTLVNGKLGYRWPHLDVSLEVLNVLDSDDHDIDYFYASRLAGEPAGGVEDIHFHPLEPRTLRVTGKWWF
ncbi:TonB-dependent receptor [Spongiibacter nanhainus]|uniref:TonB-dependent receptor n=1 Tax=Spongiibacter nanhainus TaxID=2794344 RepID=A0A7T4UNW0_9GAMM|nr:TonB-dependent receptor [Spongiibacter nanhainus]QQD16986.1 TonB-dependent receptor [Spongiibacter nanhainus]